MQPGAGGIKEKVPVEEQKGNRDSFWDFPGAKKAGAASAQRPAGFMGVPHAAGTFHTSTLILRPWD